MNKVNSKKFAYFHFLDNGKGGKAKWLGDGFCDDINNLEDCKWDLGDYI